MRPGLRAILVLLGGAPVALVAVLIAEQLWTLWAGYLGAVVLAIGADAALALPRRRLELTAATPETLFIGDGDPLVLELAAPGWSDRRRADIEILCDLHPDLEPQAVKLVRLQGGERVRLDVPLVPKRRGTVRVEAVWLRWRGPYGLTVRQRRFLIGREVRVVPNVRAVRTAAIQFYSRDAEIGMKVDRHRGDGSEFESLREYLPGFDHRRIDWKHSARHRKLVCKEFRAERNHQIVLAVDTGHLMSEPMKGIPKLDWAINAALLLGYVSVRSGDRVGLFGFDSRVRLFAEPTGGARSFRRLQQLTSDLDYRVDETNFTLGLADLATRLKRRSLVILLTDFTDTVTAELMFDNLKRLTGKHLVLFVSLRNPELAAIASAAPRAAADVARAVVADDFIREREVVIERLRRLGVHCLDAHPTHVSAAMVNEYLRIKRRELI